MTMNCRSNRDDAMYCLPQGGRVRVRVMNGKKIWLREKPKAKIAVGARDSPESI
jgi:hypothetical protein